MGCSQPRKRRLYQFGIILFFLFEEIDKISGTQKTISADVSFHPTGLSPSHAFLMMLVTDKPGIGQKELCEQLHLAPSTVTRFIDALAHKGYLTRQREGKATRVFPTEDGEQLRPSIDAAWKDLHQRYANVLGLQAGDALTAMIDEAAEELSG